MDEKDIETGDAIDATIQEHLAGCDEVLMLLSPAALESAWVLIEIGGAKALGKRLVPILLHVGINELPGPLGAGHARDLNEIDKYYEEIERRGHSPVGVAPAAGEDEESSLPRGPRSARIFNVGDRVRLPRRKPQNTYDRLGKDVGWTDEMDQYLGEPATIEFATADAGRAMLDVDNGAWVWLMDWFESTGESENPPGDVASRDGKGD